MKTLFRLAAKGAAALVIGTLVATSFPTPAQASPFAAIVRLFQGSARVASKAPSARSAYLRGAYRPSNHVTNLRGEGVSRERFGIEAEHEIQILDRFGRPIRHAELSSADRLLVDGAIQSARKRPLQYDVDLGTGKVKLFVETSRGKIGVTTNVYGLGAATYAFAKRNSILNMLRNRLRTSEYDRSLTEMETYAQLVTYPYADTIEEPDFSTELTVISAE